MDWLGRLAELGQELMERQPMLALLLGGALAALFLSTVFRADHADAPATATVGWAVYRDRRRVAPHAADARYDDVRPDQHGRNGGNGSR